MRTLFFSLLFAGVSICSYGQTFGGGSGTEGDPYKIYTPAHIKELADYVNNDVAAYGPGSDIRADRFKTYGQYFEMTDDIDMEGVTDFVPIGYTYDTNKYPIGIRCFAGHFEGNGHAILNLKYEGSHCNVGLFGRTMGATIANVKVINFQYIYTPKTNNHVSLRCGGIIGSAEYLGNADIGDTTYLRCQTFLSNCETRGNIIVTNAPYSGKKQPNIGGIIGHGFCSIRNSQSFVSVVDSSYSAVIAGIGNCVGDYSLFPMYMENCVAYLLGGSTSVDPQKECWISGVGSTGVMRHCFASGSYTATEATGIGKADSMLYCGSNATLHGCRVSGAGLRTNVMHNCFFTGSIDIVNGILSESSTLLGCQSKFVENCYVAPLRYSPSLKSSFLYNLSPKDSFPARHCFVSSKVTVSDSSKEMISYNPVRLEITKINDAEMKLPAFVTNLNQYDGSSEWQQDTIPYRNNGYPLLRNYFAAAIATTLAADSVTDHSARLHASFTFGDEAFNVKGVGIEWKKQGDSTWHADTALLEGNTLHLDNLAGETTYIFRGCIMRIVGETIYGEEMQFTTMRKIAVRESRQELQFSVSPVPASNILTVTGAAGAEACLYTTLGQKVLQIRLESESSSIDVSGLASGSYLLQIRKDGNHGVCKVQIQR